MDVNGVSTWQRAGDGDWEPGDAAELRAGVLRIASRSATGTGPERGDVSEILGAPRAAVDAAGAIVEVRTVGTDDLLVVTLEGYPDREILRQPHGVGITDVAIGGDGVITALVGGVPWLRDTHRYGEREDVWIPLSAAEHGLGPLVATRVSAGPEGAWLLAGDRVTRWAGVLLRPRAMPPTPGEFRYDPVAAPTLAWREVGTAAGAVDLAVGADGRAAVLTHGDTDAQVHLFGPDGASAVVTLVGAHRPVGVAWVGSDRIAVLLAPPDALPREAFVYPAEAGRQLPVGEFHPLPGLLQAAFLRAERAMYRTATGARVLAPLSLPVRPTVATATARVIDGRTRLVWHRLYIEAEIPDGCGIRVELGASDDGETVDRWHPHEAGVVPGVQGPRLVWLPRRCEEPGAVGWTRDLVPGRAGVFEALVQRTGHPSSRLVGRYLHARVTLFGDGRRTPALEALRARGGRFSYVDRYLPELYREDPRLEGDPGEGPATAADFWERFVAMFEGPMTSIEDLAAQAWLATHPARVPAESLEWLAGWIGRALDPSLPVDVRRRLVEAGPRLNQLRGTLAGLRLALDVVTDGGVQDGRVVVVEGWRLRRTFATILGVDLADESDPLLAGIVVNSNSVVGDTLVLGDEHHREFLALLGPRGTTAADRRAVDTFFSAMAHRVLVLVQAGLGDATVGAIRTVLSSELPAHVQAELHIASRAFVAGITALVGVDTRLDTAPPPPAARLDRTRIGTGARLRRGPGLHPDVEGDLP